VIEAAAVAAKKRGRSVKVVFASTSGSVAGTHNASELLYHPTTVPPFGVNGGNSESSMHAMHK
jgi:hypothetical protein